GYPDLTFDGVVGFYGWRDMPADLKHRIAADVRAVGADPAIGARIASAGSLVRLGGPAEFAAAIEEQRPKIAAIHSAGAKPPQGPVTSARRQISWKPWQIQSLRACRAISRA